MDAGRRCHPPPVHARLVPRCDRVRDAPGLRRGSRGSSPRHRHQLQTRDADVHHAQRRRADEERLRRRPRRRQTGVTQLKNTYTTREVAAMTGLTARQLQWWDARRVFASHIASKKTARGGYTERRYTPVDLLELLVLAELLRQGVSVAQLRRLLETL